MPSVEFEVWCTCGEGLCSQSTDVRGGIKVEPCEKCLSVAHDEGHAEGYEKGYDEGYNDGKKEEP